MRQTLLLSLFLITGCTALAPVEPSAPDSSSSSSVVSAADAILRLTLEKEISEDELATIHTKATIGLSGAVTANVDLGDILGELMVVNPNAYSPYARDGGDVLAVLTTWWAGQGEEIIVSRLRNPPSLIIEHRYGDEQGICTMPEEIADLVLPVEEIPIDLVGFEDSVEQSSIQFCYEK